MAFLDGVTVIELGGPISAAFCGKIMAALGAEVIKVEAAGAGDPARRMGPFPGDDPHPEKSGLFLYLNMGKKSLTLDIHSEAGKSILRELAARADMLVEDLGAGVMSRAGMDYGTLAKLNPRLVMTSISPFGASGDYADFKAEDITLHATSGLMYQSGSPDREPLKMGGNVAYYRAGIAAFTSSLMALHHAETSGEGQAVEVAARECLLHDEGTGIEGYITRGEVLTRQHAVMCLPATDGWYYIRAWPHEWPRFVRALGAPELATDERFVTMEQRRKHGEEINPIVMEHLQGMGKEEIYHKFQQERVTSAYLANVEDVARSKQYAARGFFVPIDHPAAGTCKYPGAFATMEGAAWRHDRAPLLGEHNAAILCDRLGYSRADLVRLRQLGAI